MKKEVKIEPLGRYVTLTENELPEIEDWQTGEEYSITLKVKMVSKSEGEYSDDDDLTGRFKVLSASTPKSKRSEKIEVMKERLQK